MTATYGTPRSLARDFANLPVSRENSGQMEKEEDTEGRKDCLSYSSHMRLAVYIHRFTQPAVLVVFPLRLVLFHTRYFSLSLDCENF